MWLSGYVAKSLLPLNMPTTTPAPDQGVPPAHGIQLILRLRLCPVPFTLACCVALDCCWPHVVAMSGVLQLTVIAGPDGVSFSTQKCVVWHACCAHFHPERPSGDSGAQGERRWDPALDICRVRMGFWTTFSECLARAEATYYVFLSCVLVVTGYVF